MWGMNGMMGASWMSLLMWVTLLLGLGLVALVIVGIIAAIRWLTKSPSPSPGGQRFDRAVEILCERYAKGGISHDEFERMRRDLS